MDRLDPYGRAPIRIGPLKFEPIRRHAAQQMSGRPECMPEKNSNSDKGKNRIDQWKLPSAGPALQLLPLSHNEFQARWSLDKEPLEAGRRAASQFEGEPRLVLRAYSLSAEADRSAFSNVWHDFRIEHLESSAFFTLPRHATRIKASIGLINKSGQFSPLVRSDAVPMPPPPAPPAEKASATADSTAPRGKELAYHASPASAVSADPENPLPDESISEEAAAPWQQVWEKSAGADIRAEFVLTGKMATGMKLLLGSEIVRPDAGGFFVWQRKLDSFDQVWPLLQAALSSPSVPAGPSLEFFKNVDAPERMLELHASVEIEGRISDSRYLNKLPEGLALDANGRFKFSRMLPSGAVILPGLSLISE